MAKQGWLGSIALAVGAGAGAAAAQFGIGYGLGVIAWAPEAGATTTADNVWLGSLAWTLWIAANSTVVGAVAADRGSAGEVGAAPPRGAMPPSGPARPTIFATAMWRALLAVSAAIGAMLSVGLVLAPAYDAGRPDTTSPQLIAAGYAVVGVTAGIVIAVCALITRAATTNVVITASWVWVLGAAAVIADVVAGRGPGAAAIEVWPLGGHSYFRNTWSFDGALLMLGSAAVIGAVAAWPAVRRGDSRVGVALSGGAGPLFITAAYMLTIPKLVGVTPDPQVSAALMSPLAVIAGLAGSALVVAAVSNRDVRSRERAAKAAAGPDESAGPARKPSPTPLGATSTGQAAPVVTASTPVPASAPVPSAPAPSAMPSKAPGPAAGKAKVVPAARGANTAEQTTARVPSASKRGSAAGSAKPSPPASNAAAGTSTVGSGPTGDAPASATPTGATPGPTSARSQAPTPGAPTKKRGRR